PPRVPSFQCARGAWADLAGIDLTGCRCHECAPISGRWPGYRLDLFVVGATEPLTISSLWNTLVLGDRWPSSRRRRSNTSAALLAMSATGCRTAVSCGLTMLIHGTSSKAITDMSLGTFIPAALSATKQPSASTLLAAKIAVGGGLRRSSSVA